jgi:hypothetical protein
MDGYRVAFSRLPEECRVNPGLIYELCMQFAPVDHLFLVRPEEDDPADGIKMQVVFTCLEDAKYVAAVLGDSQVTLFGKEIRVRHDLAIASAAPRFDYSEVGAKLFIRGLHPSTTLEEILELCCPKSGEFGELAVPPKLLRDSNGNFRGSCILSYKDFESSDKVLQQLNRQVFKDHILAVEYAEMEDGSGRRHGDELERRNAAKIIAEAKVIDERRKKSIALHQQRVREEQRANTTWASRDPYAMKR